MISELDRAFPSISGSNERLFAARAYDTPTNITSEFEEDWNRFRFLKRALRKYRRTGKVAEIIVLNHLRILYNVFGNAATRLLFLKIDKEDWGVLKTYLAFLGRIPYVVKGINDTDIDIRTVPWDPVIVQSLRKV